MAYFESTQHAPEALPSFDSAERKQLVNMSDPGTRSLFAQPESQMTTDGNGQMNFSSPYGSDSSTSNLAQSQMGDGSTGTDSQSSEFNQLLTTVESQDQEIQQLISALDQYLGGQGSGSDDSSGDSSGSTGSSNGSTGGSDGGSGTSDSGDDNDDSSSGYHRHHHHHKHSGSSGESGSDNSGTFTTSPTSGSSGGDSSSTNPTTGNTSGAGGDSSSTNPTTGNSGSTGGDSGSSSSSSNGSGPATVNSGDVLSSNPTVAAMEQSDPSLENALNAASSTMSSQGYASLESYLATNNTSANPNLDATLMSDAVSQAGLSSADSQALQTAEIGNMQQAQVLTYANLNDPTLYKTITDASQVMSSSGYAQMENYLVNNYTGDNFMDGNLMTNIATQAGLSSADQSSLAGVLQNDMPTALSSDPFAAGLQFSDATMAQTLNDASQTLSQSGYQSLESYVENNYTGQTSSDPTIMNGALSQAGLNSSDVSALTGVLQSDMPTALSSTSTGDNSGSNTTGNGSDSSGTGTNSSGTSSDSSGGSTTGSDSNSGGSSSSSSSEGGTATNGGGNNGSGTTFEVGGSTLLAPPSSDTGLVTPTGSESGDDTAYQGPIQGDISGSNGATNDSLIDGQGNGPDALQLTGGASVITTMDDETGAGFTQKYGYFEADIKVEGTPNGWPGWYLESAAHTLNPNGAASSEIDIMEAQTSSTNGDGQTAYNAGVHLNSSDYGNIPDQDQGPYTTGLPNITTGYNTYGMLWQPNDKNIEFYFDGKEVGYNPVYDTTDSSPMEMILDNGNGGWSTTDPSYSGGTMSVAYVRAYQESSLLNSTNDPNGTEGTTITDTNPDDSPPALSGVKWINTLNSDFTQASDYTTDSGYTSASVLNSQNMSEEHGDGSGLTKDPSADPDNTPWYMGEWMYDQQTSETGAAAGMSTTPGANG